MTITRRRFAATLAAIGLAGCQTTTGAVPAVTRSIARPTPNPAFDAWVASFRRRAAARGIPQATLAVAFRDAGYLPEVIERDRNQFQTRRTLEDYLAISASEDRVRTGRAMLARHRATFAAIDARFGVEPHVVAAIWGVETRFGERLGEYPVVSALATLAFAGQRGSFWESQLMGALRILERGDVAPGRMLGSWAGAMGHTQFIPTSYEAFAVDFDGDGRRDIWGADPTDALASAAAYLARSGWRRGAPWGVEVMLPAGFDAGLAGRGRARSAAAWAGLGLRAAAGGAIPDAGSAALILPAGAGGPGFLIYRNSDVIARYNKSEKYVIAVGHLSDRLAGGPPIRGAFPPDAQGLGIAERRRIQERLTALGFDTGGVDGVIGSQTEAAIRAYERRNGLPETGQATRALLDRLG